MSLPCARAAGGIFRRTFGATGASVEYARTAFHSKVDLSAGPKILGGIGRTREFEIPLRPQGLEGADGALRAIFHLVPSPRKPSRFRMKI